MNRKIKIYTRLKYILFAALFFSTECFADEPELVPELVIDPLGHSAMIGDVMFMPGGQNACFGFR